MFMQLKLEACLDEINWMIRCYNCKAPNCPQEEYPSRSLLIPPDYIDCLQSRLIKVKEGVLLPTFKMIPKDVLSSSSTSSAHNLTHRAAR